MPRRTRRRRWLTTIALHLGLGLVVNLGLALGVSLIPWDAYRQTGALLTPDGYVEHGAPATRRIEYAALIPNFANSFPDRDSFFRSERPGWALGLVAGDGVDWRISTAEFGRGWPMVALRGAFDQEPEDLSAFVGRTCFPLKIGPSTYYVAYGPVPLGLLLNTLFYAAITLTAALSWRALRRHRRVRKGRCTACGYDLAGLDRCPECGAKPTPAPA